MATKYICWYELTKRVATPLETDQDIVFTQVLVIKWRNIFKRVTFITLESIVANVGVVRARDEHQSAQYKKWPGPVVILLVNVSGHQQTSHNQKSCSKHQQDSC